MPDQLSGGLKIVVTDFMYAAPVFQQSGTELGDLTEAIGESVAGLGSFWGNDPAGRAFAGSYLPAQDQIFSRLGSAAGAVTGVGDGLQQMARNYGITEYTNAFMAESLAQAEASDVESILSQRVHRPNLPPLVPGGGTPGSSAMPRPDPRPQAAPGPLPAPPTPRPRPVTIPRPAASPTPDPRPGPPPSTPVNMGNGWWEIGIPWPAASEGSLLEAGDQWTRLGNGILNITAPANSQAASIASNNEGKAVDAFESYWKSYGGSGGELDGLAQACHSVAQACYRCADTVTSTKRKIEETVVEVGAVLLAGAIASFFSAGATGAAADTFAAGLIAGARAVLSFLFDTAVPDIAADLLTAIARVAALAMAGGFITDANLLAVDLVKTAFGEDLPPVAEQLMDVLHGAEGGAVAGPLGDLGGMAAENVSKQLEEIGDGIASGQIKVTDPAIAGKFLWLADVFAAGGKAAADLTGTTAAQLVVNHEFSMRDLTTDFVSSNIAEAIREMQEEGG